MRHRRRTTLKDSLLILAVLLFFLCAPIVGVALWSAAN